MPIFNYGGLVTPHYICFIGLMEALSEEFRDDSRDINITFTCVYPFIVDKDLAEDLRVR